MASNPNAHLSAGLYTVEYLDDAVVRFRIFVALFIWLGFCLELDFLQIRRQPTGEWNCRIEHGIASLKGCVEGGLCQWRRPVEISTAPASIRYFTRLCNLMDPSEILLFPLPIPSSLFILVCDVILIFFVSSLSISGRVGVSLGSLGCAQNLCLSASSIPLSYALINIFPIFCLLGF